MHLSRIRVREFTELQFDDDETAEPSVKKQQVDSVPFVSDAQPTLASDKREIISEFEKECLQLADQGALKLGLGILILKREELENIGILDLLVRCDGIARLPSRALA